MLWEVCTHAPQLLELPLLLLRLLRRVTLLLTHHKLLPLLLLLRLVLRLRYAAAATLDLQHDNAACHISQQQPPSIVRPLQVQQLCTQVVGRQPHIPYAGVVVAAALPLATAACCRMVVLVLVVVIPPLLLLVWQLQHRLQHLLLLLLLVDRPLCCSVSPLAPAHSCLLRPPE